MYGKLRNHTRQSFPPAFWFIPMSADVYCSDVRRQLVSKEWMCWLVRHIYIYIYIYIYMCVCVCVCVFLCVCVCVCACLYINIYGCIYNEYVYIYIFTELPNHEPDAIQGLFFKRSLTDFKLKIFLLLVRLPNQSKIHAFLKDISTMGNTNSHLQTLNSGAEFISSNGNHYT